MSAQEVKTRVLRGLAGNPSYIGKKSLSSQKRPCTQYHPSLLTELKNYEWDVEITRSIRKPPFEITFSVPLDYAQSPVKDVCHVHPRKRRCGQDGLTLALIY